MSTALTVSDQIDLSHLEKAIEKGKEAVQKMALALLEIRDRRLYREKYGTFEQYCQGRWGFSDRYGRMLINFAENIRQIESGTLVPVVLPENERQSRPLNILDSPNDKAIAMNVAVAIAPQGRLTANEVARAAAAVKAKPVLPVVGTQAIVLHETSPHYGKVVQVTQVVHEMVVECEVDGQTEILLANELASEQVDLAPPPKEVWSQKLKQNPFEYIEARSQVAELRCAALEKALARALVALKRTPDVEPELIALIENLLS